VKNRGVEVGCWESKRNFEKSQLKAIFQITNI
jgi:hypothetical protein